MLTHVYVLTFGSPGRRLLSGRGGGRGGGRRSNLRLRLLRLRLLRLGRLGQRLCVVDGLDSRSLV